MRATYSLTHVFLWAKKGTAGGDGVISGSQTVTVQASATDSADAKATGLAGGIIAGAGAGSTATVAPTIQAYTLGNITATTSLSITAALTPKTIARTIGVAVSYLYGVGASNSQAIDDATISAYVGAGSQLTGGTLSVSAQQLLPSDTTPSAYASAVAAGGGTLLGANATVANASTSGSVEAYTGRSVKLPDGDVSISATSNTAQSAVAIGVSVGYVALGADTCTANSSVTTEATLGANASTNLTRTGAISKVDITDTNLPATSNQKLYVYQPGQPIQVYTGAAGATLGTGTPSSTISGTSAAYSPQSGLRWKWVESASLSRTVDLGKTSTVTNWTFNGNANNPWQYIDSSTGQPYIDPTSGLNVPIGQIVNQPGGPVFRETITGSASDGASLLIYYHNGHFGFAPANPVQTESDGRTIDPWTYNYATYGSLTLTMSVKADNSRRQRPETRACT